MTPEIFAGKASPAHLAGPSPQDRHYQVWSGWNQVGGPNGAMFQRKKSQETSD